MQKEAIIRETIVEQILQQLLDRRDEGGLFYQEGAATTTETLFDLYKDFNHLVSERLLSEQLPSLRIIGCGFSGNIFIKEV